MPERRVYKVTFVQRSEVYEIFAEGVSHGSMVGFVEIEGLLFGERSTVVVDPNEEKLAAEFKGVKRTFVPVHAVVRIDEVERQGVSRISKRAKGEGTLTPFPNAGMPGTPPDGGDSK